MANKKLVKYFNSLTGKHLETEDREQGLLNSNTIGAEILDILINTKQRSQFCGKDKYCCFFGDGKVYALLKNKKQANACELLRPSRYLNNIISINRSLINQGVLVPKLYSIFYMNKKNCEIQHRFEGLPIYKANVQDIFKGCRNTKYIDPVTVWRMFGDAVFKYNVQQQQLMLQLPQEEFDKLLKSYEILVNMNFPISDNHSENILVSENGFQLVDLDYHNFLQSKGHDTSTVNNKIKFLKTVGSFIQPFTFSKKFCAYYSAEQNQQIDKNDDLIATKLKSSIVKLGVKPQCLENKNIMDLFMFFYYGDAFMDISSNMEEFHNSKPNLYKENIERHKK